MHWQPGAWIDSGAGGHSGTQGVGFQLSLCSPPSPRCPRDLGGPVLTPLNSLLPDPPRSAQHFVLAVPAQPFPGVRRGPVGSGAGAGLWQESRGEVSKLFPPAQPPAALLSLGSCPAPPAARRPVLPTAPPGSERLSARPSLPPLCPPARWAGPARGLRRDARALAEVTQSQARINPGLPMSKTPGHCQTGGGGTRTPSTEAAGVNPAHAHPKGGAGAPGGQG